MKWVVVSAAFFLATLATTGAFAQSHSARPATGQNTKDTKNTKNTKLSPSKSPVPKKITDRAFDPFPCRISSCSYAVLPEISRYFKKQEVAQLIQTAATQLYRKAYLELGSYGDFMHGHVLLTRKQGKVAPFAVLYHTQESLFGEMLETDFEDQNEAWAKSHALDYLDRRNRNFIQFLDRPQEIINAARYLLDPLPEEVLKQDTDSPAEAQSLKRQLEMVREYFLQPTLVAPLSPADQKLSFGIGSNLLDPEKVGYEKYEHLKASMDYESFAIDFVKTDCATFKSTATDNGIQISLPTGKTVCLYLSGH